MSRGTHCINSGYLHGWTGYYYSFYVPGCHRGFLLFLPELFLVLVMGSSVINVNLSALANTDTPILPHWVTRRRTSAKLRL